jgi:hypothetical protein
VALADKPGPRIPTRKSRLGNEKNFPGVWILYLSPRRKAADIDISCGGRIRTGDETGLAGHGLSVLGAADRNRRTRLRGRGACVWRRRGAPIGDRSAAIVRRGWVVDGPLGWRSEPGPHPLVPVRRIASASAEKERAENQQSRDGESLHNMGRSYRITAPGDNLI